MRILSKAQIIKLHTQLIDEYGGTDGIRDMGLFESAIYAPFQMFGEIEAYPTLREKGVRLGYGLIKNHAFIDGNKRIGVHTMLVFLALNGICLDYSQDELIDVVLKVASGEYDYEKFLNWVIIHQIFSR